MSKPSDINYPKYTVDFDKATLELRKADKYYISFRLLNRWGYYFQGINCLLFSLETLFKLIYILDNESYTNKKLKDLGHNLRKAFNEVKLDKQELNVVFKIISIYGYTEIRYDSPDLVNELNRLDQDGKYTHLGKLHLEIEKLHKIITQKIRTRFNVLNYRNGLHIHKYHLLDSIDKKNIIEDCLSKGDPNFSFDRC